MAHIIVTNEKQETYKVFRSQGDAIVEATTIVSVEGVGMANIYEFDTAKQLVEEGIGYLVSGYQREF